VFYDGARMADALAHIAFFLLCCVCVCVFFDCTKILFPFFFLWMIMMKRKNRRETILYFVFFLELIEKEHDLSVMEKRNFIVNRKILFDKNE
jgi:hypothetical protein